MDDDECVIICRSVPDGAVAILGPERFNAPRFFAGTRLEAVERAAIEWERRHPHYSEDDPEPP